MDEYWERSDLFKPEFFVKLDQLYQNEILKLKKTICYKCTQDWEPLLENFNEKFFVTKELIDLLESEGHKYEDKNLRFFPWKKQLEDPFLTLDLRHPSNFEYKILEKSIDNKIQLDLQYPMRYGREYLLMYQAISSNPVPEPFIQKCEKMQEEYWKIKAVESNIEEWISILSKATNDVEFVKNSIEYRLGNDITNKQFWKAYIRYLEVHDPKEMLKVYSKYVRFFLSDGEMKSEYAKKVQKYGPVFVQWKNLLPFENQLKKIANPSSSNIAIEHEPLPCPKFVFNPIRQNWPFHSHFIEYITKTANPKTLQKLYQSCKWFFVKRNEILCHQMIFTKPSKNSASERSEKIIFNFDGNSLHCFYYYNLPDEKKFCIINSLSVSHKNDYLLSSIIKQKRLFKCYAKFINIAEQYLTEKEWNFLVGHGNVERLVLDKTTIMKENGIPMMIDEIIATLPKLQYLRCNDTFFFHSVGTPRPYEFRFIQLQSKLLHFKLFQPADNFDCDDFCIFIKNNAARSSMFSITAYMTNDKKAQLKQCFNEHMSSWDSSTDKPILEL